MVAIRSPLLPSLVAAVLLSGACACAGANPPPLAGAGGAPVAAQTAAPATAADVAHALPPGIAWHVGDVDSAFAQARAQRKPLFLYWGATWCPPCNQVKATIFNRAEFIARSRLFVPVYLDGDAPGAQRLATRFNVSGYPTMVLFAPNGAELTRLPGEVDPLRYLDTLQAGLAGSRPVRLLLAAALAPVAPVAPAKVPALSAQDWQMLAFYSWATDDQALVPHRELPATLARLAAACPANDPAAPRLAWQAAAAAAERQTTLAPAAVHPVPIAGASSAPASPPAAPIDRAVAMAQVERVIADPQQARAQFDLLTADPDDLVAWLTPADSPARSRLLASWDAALARLADDPTLSTTDRVGATLTRVALARQQAPAPAPLPDALLAVARRDAARADQVTTDRYERQSVVSAAADLLATAGLVDASDALLKAELTRSHAPYYFMSGLAANAKQRGDHAAALDWSAQAWQAAQGPATRLQWGSSYVRLLMELAPADVDRIERTLGAVLGELTPQPATFDGRNARALERLKARVAEWNAGGQHAAVVRRVAARLAPTCAQLPAGSVARQRCTGVLAGA